MSYYNNGRGGYNNNGYRHHHRGGGPGGGGFHHQPRINENQVPQSKHTIFIRGLSDVTTEEIKEYIGERVGEISFDFVKTSLDRTKIFVAVRFEKREEAKQFMETYSDREFMGYRVELSWFRDIRRYCAYQRSKKPRSKSPRRRRRSDSEGSHRSSRKSSPAGRSNSRDRESRSGSRASKRSRSRSADRSRSSRRSRSRSRSADRSNLSRSHSRGSDRRSRSRSRENFRRDPKNRNYSISPLRTAPLKTERISADTDDEEDKRRIRERQDRYRKRRGPSYSEDDDGEVEEKVKEEKKVPKKPKAAQIPLPPPAEEVKPPKAEIFIPPPTEDMEIDSPKTSPPPHHTNPYANIPKRSEPIPAVQSTMYSVSMEEEVTPKRVIREIQPAGVPAAVPPVDQQQYGQVGPVAPAQPVGLPPFIPRQIGKIEIVMPASLPAPPVAPVPPASTVVEPSPVAPTSSSTLSAFSNGAGLGLSSASSVDPSSLQQTNKFFGHLKTIQSELLQSFENELTKPEEKKEGGFTLSHNLQYAENQKIMEREEKLSRLSGQQTMHFHVKKKHLEASFRNDCETYAHVTRALFAKDTEKSQEFHTKLWASLFENMEDLYNKMMDRVDELLDQLLLV